MTRKRVRCDQCLRWGTNVPVCTAGEKTVLFDHGPIAKARRYCDAHMPDAAWVDTGNTIVDAPPLELFDGKVWHSAPRRVGSPWKLH